MKRVVVLVFVCLLLLLAAGSLATSAAVPANGPGWSPLAQGSSLQPTIIQAVHSDTSRPLRSIQPVSIRFSSARPDEPIIPIKHPSGGPTTDPVIQHGFGPFVMPTPIQNFEGVNNLWGGYPPDTNGEVGPNNYVQQVNIGFQVWDKSGNSLYGPANFNTLFAGFGGGCERRNDGDPLILYDQLADRWILSQFTTGAPYLQCIAISTSGDPTGSYYRYAFPETAFEDYPHMGVWPDAYYMSANENGGRSVDFAFERDRMLVGDPSARLVSLSPENGDSGLLPSDLDGFTPPPPGSPNYYLSWYNNNPGQLALYKFHVDWTTPINSTFTGPTYISVANFNTNTGGIEQPGTNVRLDDLSDRLMFRVAYRNFGDHEALVTNHTVLDSTTSKAAIRWYEVRDPNGTPTLYQQGTYSPDATNRWMGSVAMDHQGNIAVGYSVSSSSVYPSIRYAGRLVSDPLGQLSQGETTLYNGTGSQTGPEARWGDYSDITVDPVDDCTFWYTTEYIQVTGERTWRTRIGSFKFPGCTAIPPTATVTGTPPTAQPTHTPSNTPTTTPTLCPLGVTYTDSITNTDGTQAGRVALRPPVSTCDQPKSCASPLDTIPRHYKSYTYVNNTGSSECVTVNLVENCSNNALWSVAYLNSFNPNSLCQNYLADGGRGGPVTTYSFSAPAGATIVVVVNEVNANVGCENYTLTINPCSTAGGPTYTPTNTPTLTGTSVPATATSTSTPSVTATGQPGTPTVTSTPCTINFTDVSPSDYFYVPVTYLYCHGAISGYADNTFRPYNDTTRGQLSKIVVLAEGWQIDTTGGPHFTDVPTNHPFYAYVETAYNHSIISGYADNTFRPYNNITRGQLTKVIVLAQHWAITPPSQPTFRDVPTNDPFYGYIETAYAHQVISGYSCGTGCLEFRPGNNATRGQISKIVYLAVTAP